MAIFVGLLLCLIALRIALPILAVLVALIISLFRDDPPEDPQAQPSLPVRGIKIIDADSGKARIAPSSFREVLFGKKGAAMKHILSVVDLSADDLERIIAASATMKERYRKNINEELFRGKTLGMYFEKPSLRTRVSLECAINSLGGGAISLEASGPGKMWERECIRDQARVMSRFVSMVSMRTFAQADIEEFARESSVPVVNVLSDYEHPTQAMADYLTMRERFGDLRGKTLVYLGDGNNVARSLLSGAALLGVKFVWSGPAEYRLEREYLEKVKAKIPGAVLVEETNPEKALRDADAVYTDVWASMGQEAESNRRARDFAAYQVNDALLRHAPSHAIVLHCLPAHRGLEITDSVMDAPSSRAAMYDQAENRMHVYRGLFSLWAGEWK